MNTRSIPVTFDTQVKTYDPALHTLTLKCVVDDVGEEGGDLVDRSLDAVVDLQDDFEAAIQKTKDAWNNSVSEGEMIGQVEVPEDLVLASFFQSGFHVAPGLSHPDGGFVSGSPSLAVYQTGLPNYAQASDGMTDPKVITLDGRKAVYDAADIPQPTRSPRSLSYGHLTMAMNIEGYTIDLTEPVTLFGETYNAGRHAYNPFEIAFPYAGLLATLIGASCSAFDGVKKYGFDEASYLIGQLAEPVQGQDALWGNWLSSIGHAAQLDDFEASIYMRRNPNIAGEHTNAQCDESGRNYPTYGCRGEPRGRLTSKITFQSIGNPSPPEGSQYFYESYLWGTMRYWYYYVLGADCSRPVNFFQEGGAATGLVPQLPLMIPFFPLLLNGALSLLMNGGTNLYRRRKINGRES